MSKTNIGLGAIYDGGLTPGLQIGSGRHRHRGGSKRGRGFMDHVKKLHSYIKDNKVISKIGDFAKEKGYGRRRRGGRRRRHRVMGGSKRSKMGGRRRRRHRVMGGSKRHRR